MTEKQKSMTHRLVLMAMFVAVQIILSRFPFHQSLESEDWLFLYPHRSCGYPAVVGL